MKREIELGWTEEEKRLAERQRREWESFFAGREAKAGGARSKPAQLAGDAAVAEVQQRRQDELLKYPNVVGVAAGIRTRRGKPTGEPCLVVYVSRKLPKKDLSAKEILPRRLDGVTVDVVEAGELKPLPA